MSETGGTERVPAACPACGEETVHEVLSSGGHATVRCTDCAHTHKTELPEPETVAVDVVVSQDGESWPTSYETDPDETVAVGDEFVVETPEAFQQVRVTAVERGKSRVESAPVTDLATVWTRVVDNVAVPVTIHPNDDEPSRSEKLYVPGDREFTVGDTEEAGDEEFEVTAIGVRDDVEGYPAGTMDRDGDTVFAKDIKRLYGRDQRTSAWRGW